MRFRSASAQQRLVSFPLVRRIERLQKLHFACCEQRDGDSVPVEQTVAGQRRKPRPRCDDTDEVEWVGA